MIIGGNAANTAWGSVWI